MVVIRFQRMGTKKTPHHRIVVTDRQRAQSSRTLEVVGYYDPSASPAKFSIDANRVSHWVALGARASEAVQRLLKKSGKQAAVVK